MARYTGPVCKQCRREGQKLFLKGERCYSEKCPMSREKDKRDFAPGQHGKGRKKMSEYGLQLRAKQKAKRYYGVLEGQFHKYFLMAAKEDGVTGEALLQIVESRLDNLVYRLGFATSRPEARVLVAQGHFAVNGKKADISSMLLKAGDVIEVSQKSKSSPKFKDIAEANASRPVPVWLESDIDTLKGTYIRRPARDEIDFEVEEHLIVEGYSK